MNSSTHHLLVFDWDGTLLNSTQAIISALQKTAQDFALPVPDNNAASYVIGMGFREALEIANEANLYQLSG